MKYLLYSFRNKFDYFRHWEESFSASVRHLSRPSTFREDQVWINYSFGKCERTNVTSVHFYRTRFPWSGARSRLRPDSEPRRRNASHKLHFNGNTNTHHPRPALRLKADQSIQAKVRLSNFYLKPKKHLGTIISIDCRLWWEIVRWNRPFQCNKMPYVQRSPTSSGRLEAISTAFSACLIRPSGTLTNRTSSTETVFINFNPVKTNHSNNCFDAGVTEKVRSHYKIELNFVF